MAHKTTRGEQVVGTGMGLLGLLCVIGQFLSLALALLVAAAAVPVGWALATRMFPTEAVWRDGDMLLHVVGGDTVLRLDVPGDLLAICAGPVRGGPVLGLTTVDRKSVTLSLRIDDPDFYAWFHQRVRNEQHLRSCLDRDPELRRLLTTT